MTVPAKRRKSTQDEPSKDICEIFYGKKPVDASANTWRCTCGVVRKCNPSKNGYKNLLSHLVDKHENYLEIYRAHKQEEKAGSVSESGNSNTGRQYTLDYLIDDKSRDIFKWLEWVVMDEMGIGFCEKALTRENSNLQPISAKTLKKYMLLLVDEVEKKITALVEARQCFALIFDGWTEDSTHFIGMSVE
jgi:hypothetical protein